MPVSYDKITPGSVLLEIKLTGPKRPYAIVCRQFRVKALTAADAVVVTENGEERTLWPSELERMHATTPKHYRGWCHKRGIKPKEAFLAPRKQNKSRKR